MFFVVLDTQNKKKVAEKVIGFRLVPFLQRNAFGDNHWEVFYGPGRKRPGDDAHYVMDPRNLLRTKSRCVSQ